MFQFEICELTKYHHACFPPQPYKASKPFSIIHSDVWGPSRVITFFNKRWFITYIDDHTQICCVYLSKEKYKTTQVFKNFHNMV